MAVLSRTEGRKDGEKMRELRYSFCRAFHGNEETERQSSQITNKLHA
jgi:hypothetical protein